MPATNRPDNHEEVKMVDLKNRLSGIIRLPGFIARFLEKILGLERLNKAYAKIVKAMRMGSKENFFTLATHYLGLKYELTADSLTNIPVTGPVVVVANHPHGMSDGLIFGDILLRRRSDACLVVNELLGACKEMEPWMIKVNAFESDEAKRQNYQGMKQTLGWLKKGGCIGIFPAGSASSYSLKDRHVTDDPWNPNFAALIRRTKATVVPVYFAGRNSIFFQIVSLISRKARLLLLARQVGRDARIVQKVIIGKPISAGQLAQFDSDDALVAHLRLRTYLLAKHYDKKRTPFCANALNTEDHSNKEPIISAIPPDDLEKEITALPEDQLLVSKNNWQVHYASADQIPLILKELGRLREITFRAVGEGSGTSCDLDKYDPHYHHLFLWDKEKRCIAGAYRMGLTDKILETYGKDGLYNNQFFHFDDEALAKINPGLEMGRAFITKDYQKRPFSLGLIWEGIGQFIAKFPHYRYLFGTVSTSGAYTTLSHSLIVSFLKAHAMDEELAALIKAKKPPQANRLKKPENRIFPMGVTDAQDLSSIVSEIESDGKGIPVLLRQYLKLNGKIVSFGIDKEFGNVLDSLIVVDIYKSPERSLRRYLGDAAYEKIKTFLEQTEALENQEK